MSFIQNNTNNKVYAPGHFLAHEECTRVTKQITASTLGIAGVDGSKYVPMGTVYPSNDANAEGIVYEDVDVTTGNMPGSVVTAGTIYEDRLPEKLNSSAKAAMPNIILASVLPVGRPY
jgi:hypothetical protein